MRKEAKLKFLSMSYMFHTLFYLLISINRIITDYNEKSNEIYLNSTIVTPISPSPKVPSLYDIIRELVFKKV